MFQELNKQILEIKEKQRMRYKLLSRLDSASKSLQMHQSKKLDLGKVLVKEELDVNKLSSLSLSALFHTILGDKKDQLDKEKQEFLAARLKYDECCNAIKALEQEVYNCEKSLQEYSKVDREYQSLMETKQALILKNKDQNAQWLLDQFEKVSSLQIQINEIMEAIEASTDVKEILLRAVNSLKSAEGWGTWDILGGGILATSIKHDKVDEARDYVSQAQRLLNRFAKELADINISKDMNIDISVFESFSDYFFDGLISDWVVQDKIENSLYNVQHIYQQMCRIIRKLESRSRLVKLELDNLNEGINKFIEQMK